jgi:hypothetical protein
VPRSNVENELSQVEAALSKVKDDLLEADSSKSMRRKLPGVRAALERERARLQVLMNAEIDKKRDRAMDREAYHKREAAKLEAARLEANPASLIQPKISKRRQQRKHARARIAARIVPAAPTAAPNPPPISPVLSAPASPVIAPKAKRKSRAKTPAWMPKASDTTATLYMLEVTFAGGEDALLDLLEAALHDPSVTAAPADVWDVDDDGKEIELFPEVYDVETWNPKLGEIVDGLEAIEAGDVRTEILVKNDRGEWVGKRYADAEDEDEDN